MEICPLIQKSKLQTKWKAPSALDSHAAVFVSSRTAPRGGALRDETKTAARETTPVWKYYWRGFHSNGHDAGVRPQT